MATFLAKAATVSQCSRGTPQALLLGASTSTSTSLCAMPRLPARTHKALVGKSVFSILPKTSCHALSFKQEEAQVTELQFVDEALHEALDCPELEQAQEEYLAKKDAINGSAAFKQAVVEEPINAPALAVAAAAPAPAAAAAVASEGPIKTFKIWFSDVVVSRKHRPYWFRDWTMVDFKTATGVAASHVLALWAPFTFSWDAFAVAFVMWVITGIGVTLSYHRNLSHRSFKVPKWLEYTFAYCGVHALQGDPSFWASAHRFHHKHCETERDPHSPTHGVWHSHMGWFVDRKVLLNKVALFENIPDMINDPFYEFIRKTYELHPLMMGFLMYKLGGFPYLVWCMGVRGVWTYHHTFFVNSVCHIWGDRKYKTNDFSRNNWWVSFFCFGEGWHNNHHAFPSAALHGIEWWEIDPTGGIIRFLEKIGLATDVKRVSQETMTKLALK